MMLIEMLDGIFQSHYDGKQGCRTWSESSIHRAHIWLEDCNNSHTRCKTNRNSFIDAGYPKRLLDLRKPNKGFVTLLESFSSSRSTKYAALSHCWGKAKQGHLLLGNRENYLCGESLSELPKTFNDAIDVCQNLGIEYLWIDSLCIIQDSLDDWNSEAIRMADIYANSYLTIAATASSDDHGGLFKPLHPLATFPMDFSVPKKGLVRAAKVRAQYQLHELDLWNKYVNEAPLYQRAWVFQERLLSSRVLHFAENQLYWQCRSLEDTDSAEGLNYRWSREHAVDLLPAPTDAVHDDEIETGIEETASASWIGLRPEETSPKDWLKVWDKIVYNYSPGRLTVPTDKLVAISGLAQRIQQLSHWSPSDYLAGLWRQGLPRNLLWETRT